MNRRQSFSDIQPGRHGEFPKLRMSTTLESEAVAAAENEATSWRA
jgi:hypothetical protein